MKREVKIHGIYKHYKGNLYIVEGIALNSETLEKMVLYRGLYGEHELWARPIEMFLEGVDLGGEKKWRFKEVERVEPNNESK